MERFWQKVTIDEAHNCWVWNGPTTTKGYGHIRLQGKWWQAHRLAWTLIVGDIPETLCVCHHCDNKLCVNPSHLFVGTVADNNADMWQKGRGVLPDEITIPHYGEDNGQSKLTGRDVLTIRRLAREGISNSALASDFRISVRQIGRVIRRECWGWLV